MWKNRKGFTTIELILAIAIAGVIMGAVGSFLTFNLRGFNQAKDIIDIQYEGQLAINQLSSIAQESIGITAIDDQGGTDSYTYTTEVTPGTVEFVQDVVISGVDYEYTYHITYDPITDPDNPKILCQLDKENISASSTVSDAQYVMAQYVDAFTLEPTGGSYQTTKSVVIKMTFAEGKASYDLQTEVKFRNKR